MERALHIPSQLVHARLKRPGTDNMYDNGYTLSGIVRGTRAPLLVREALAQNTNSLEPWQPLRPRKRGVPSASGRD